MIKKWLIIIIVIVPFLLYAEENFDYNEDVELPDKQLVQSIKNLETNTLSDLVYLAPFSDIVVIHRRFMPKTGRISLSALVSFILSSEFFINPTIEGHFSFHFLEKHGVELSCYYSGSFNRRITSSLKDIGVRADEVLPIAKSFIGLTYKWMPVYGKISFRDKAILAFDTFFNIGAGMSQITKKSTTTTLSVWEPTAIVGVGQVFAMTRNLGLRWDLRWHATVRTKAAANVFLNDFLLSVGVTQYYPKAGSR